MGEFSSGQVIEVSKNGNFPILPANIDMFRGKSTSTTLFGGIYVTWREGLYFQVSKMSHAIAAMAKVAMVWPISAQRFLWTWGFLESCFITLWLFNIAME